MRRMVMKILVVCHGNVARSQFAHVVLDEHTDHEIRSAGVGKTAGKDSPMSKNMRRLANKMGYGVSVDIDMYTPRSSKATEEDVAWADIVLYMDNPNLVKLNDQFPEHKDKFQRLGDALIPDPGFFGGSSAPERILRKFVAETIQESILRKFT